MDDSPTMDEQNHLGRGVAFVHSGDPRLSLEHPPLVNGLAALPTLLMDDLHVPFEHSSWQLEPPDIYWYLFADQLMWRSGNDVSMMLFLARLPIVFLTLGLALVGFHFGRQVWKLPLPAYLTFIFLLFDPNVMANGRYVTTDLGGTLFMFLATFLLWRLWQQAHWDWRRWLWAGIGMGLAFGSKLSALGFIPIWVVMALLPLHQANTLFTNDVFANERFDWRLVGQRLLQLLSAGLFSTLIVWLIFGLEWGAFRFQSDLLIGFNYASGPMPTFWAGIEKILLLSGGGRGAYLLGDYSVDGFATYFPVAFLAKTPLPTLVGLGIASIVLLWQRSTRRHALFLLLLPLLYFGATLQSNLNIGYRHLLPMLPFIYLLISGLSVSRQNQSSAGAWRRYTLTHATQFIPHAVGVGLIAAMLWIHPHYLGFFNWAAGGPKNGHTILLDSNIDWGQDLLRLQEWMDENGVERVKLGWFGTAVPAHYTLQYQPLPGFPQAEFLSLWTQPPFNPAAPEAGVYAISVSNLMELPSQSGVYTWFRQRQPDARIGYSIWIYEVE